MTGASGMLGCVALPRLGKQGYDVRPMSRSPKPGWAVADLRSGDGLADAVRDVDVIVHLASAPGRPRKTDVEGTARLLTAARTAGVRHVLYVSINGIDRVPYRYYQAKLDTEEVVRTSGVPFTILRASQFHPFADKLLSAFSTLGPLIVDPKWRLQPVAVEDVADRIAELIALPPAGETTEFAGPQILTGDEMARTWIEARGSRRPIWRMPIPGRMSRAIRAGGQTSRQTPTGTHTWQEYLTSSRSGDRAGRDPDA